METLFKHPYFWIGIFVCWLLFKVTQVFRTDRKRDTQRREINNGKATIDKLLDQVRREGIVDLDSFYARDGKGKEQIVPGYFVWKDLAYWLTYTYANYRYLDSPIGEFWNLVELYFGKTSAAYKKMVALDEIINRSTKYYTNGGLPYRKNEEHDKTQLYDMVQMIVDSFAPDVYESNRADKK